SAGISKISPTAPGPEKWQYIFYILGAVTMAWSFIILFFLPDSPASARFLKPEMRVLAVQRVAANQLGIKNKKFKKEQVWVAVKDIKIWILFSSVFAAAIPNGVVSNFSSVIIKDMGFSTTKTTVLKSVGDITQIVALVVGGVITLNFKNTRLLASTGANIICVVSAACMAYLPRHLVWQRLVSFWLVNCQSVGFAASLVMVSSNMGGYTHRTIASAVIFTAYCFGNVAGPFVYSFRSKQSQAPFYQDATAGLLAGYTIKLVCQITLLIYMFTINKRRDNKYGEPDVAAAKEAGMQDKTEYENKDFRYVL
ncbi:MFS transporter, partial [Favolaschia claudopus]